MDWANERYVRVYTRNTAEWHAFVWQAKALLPLMLRACDRSGVMQVKPGPARTRLVAGLVGLPVEVVEAGLADLLVDGCLVESDLGYTFRNFIDAQETPASDAKRAKDYRERRKVVGMVEATRNVTAGNENGRTVTREADFVTPNRAVPCLAVPNQKLLREPPAAPSAAAEAFKLEPSPPEALPSKASEWEELRDRLDDARVRARPDCPDDPGFCAKRDEANAVLRKSAAWLAEKFSVPLPDAKVLMRKAAWVYAADDWPGRQAGMTPWSLWVFVKRKHLGTYAAQAQGMTWVHDELEDLWHPVGWKP